MLEKQTEKQNNISAILLKHSNIIINLISNIFILNFAMFRQSIFFYLFF